MLQNKEKKQDSNTYRWNIRVILREQDIKDKETIMVWSALWPNDDSPKEIHPCFVDPYIYCI